MKKGLDKSAVAQAESSQGQINRLNDLLQQTTAGYQPYTDLGANGANAYADLMGLGGSSAGMDWAAYVNGNPDALANWNAIKGTTDGAQFNGDIGAFGQYHYAKDGSRRGLSPFTSEEVSAGDAQAQAIAGLEKSPLFASLIRNGEEAINANASATGGLRGGNNIDRLTNFRTDTLTNVIQNQLQGYQGAIGTGMGAQGQVAQVGSNVATGQNQATQTSTDALIQKILGKAGISSQGWANAGSTLDGALKGVLGGGFSVKNLAKSLF